MRGIAMATVCALVLATACGDDSGGDGALAGASGAAGSTTAGAMAGTPTAGAPTAGAPAAGEGAPMAGTGGAPAAGDGAPAAGSGGAPAAGDGAPAAGSGGAANDTTPPASSGPTSGLDGTRPLSSLSVDEADRFCTWAVNLPGVGVEIDCGGGLSVIVEVEDTCGALLFQTCDVPVAEAETCFLDNVNRPCELILDSCFGLLACSG